MSIAGGFNNTIFGNDLYQQEVRKGLFKPFSQKNNFGRQQYPMERMGEIYNFNQPFAQKFEQLIGLPFSAWSCSRKLFDNYNGACIQVRRSADNELIDIFFNSNNEVDTDTLLGFLGSNSGFVRTLYDQSGAGNNFVQTTLANQPRIVNAGIVDTVNSKPSLRFDGVNDVMGVANSTATYKWMHDTDDANFCQYVFMAVQAGFSSNPNAFYSFVGNNNTTTASRGFLLNYEDSASLSANNKIEAFTTRNVANTTVFWNLLNNTFIPNKLNTFSAASLRSASAINRSVVVINNSTTMQANASAQATNNANATQILQLGGPGNSVVLLAGFISELIMYRTNQREYVDVYDVNQDLINFYKIT
jgi:hypothetical protein